MEVKHIQRNDKGAFKLYDGEVLAGVLEYEILTSEVLSALHTETQSGFEGKGVGATLFNALIDFVKNKELKINPLCPFVKAKLEKDESLHYLIAKM
ncbi:GNAT family N-acetyltransferase [Taibaiella sp. KBW10]|uniref:GNAT family N-acetyltransferase n=1 Tax=Taibaiella sp. KBW10 TaxID=2153357 RepID=UPI000F59AB14|nr:GNAT family N-acetyltransferase [Taibaiella sp. KBW10]RQO32006.1 GNAT family N-acetyltransferase [Taibaiella sp. KBW10]